MYLKAVKFNYSLLSEQKNYSVQPRLPAYRSKTLQEDNNNYR